MCVDDEQRCKKSGKALSFLVALFSLFAFWWRTTALRGFRGKTRGKEAKKERKRLTVLHKVTQSCTGLLQQELFKVLVDGVGAGSSSGGSGSGSVVFVYVFPVDGPVFVCQDVVVHV